MITNHISAYSYSCEYPPQAHTAGISRNHISAYSYSCEYPPQAHTAGISRNHISAYSYSCEYPPQAHTASMITNHISAYSYSCEYPPQAHTAGMSTSHISAYSYSCEYPPQAHTAGMITNHISAYSYSCEYPPQAHMAGMITNHISAYSYSCGAQEQAVWAQVGHKTHLQCVTPPPIITDWQTLRLFVQKPLPGALPQVVFSFSNGREEPEHQAGRFQNRTRLTRDNLTLTLMQVSPQDEGRYDCRIFTLMRSGYELTHQGQQLLSVWAAYEPPQISLSSFASCSAGAGYPSGHIKWKFPLAGPDISRIGEIHTEQDPQTLLYNISGWLNTSELGGAISCCVTTPKSEVCSDQMSLTPRGRSGTRGRGGEMMLVCIIQLLTLAVRMT
ncbi:T-lymphocyte activation antigen CD80 [Hyperolius riggenbachi]|uniref:T-lymphocyte activation antigen CD80 n=1 Tax=Hyperolius riggenbachi TaxID=752182 RepID=UPI0035A2B497